MRGIVLSLAAVLSLGIAVAGGRATAADRAAHNRTVVNPEVPAATLPASRVWYGGTLPPIIVVATPPERSATRQAVSCQPVGG
jgi:drug/metabolite transporter (DMT)-like permease